MPKTLENRLDDLMHEIQEIKKSIVLDKFAKVEGGQKKINAWKNLGKKISSKWDGLSAVEEIIEQREKTW
jgi:hypothetical protein